MGPDKDFLFLFPTLVQSQRTDTKLKETAGAVVVLGEEDRGAATISGKVD